VERRRFVEGEQEALEEKLLPFEEKLLPFGVGSVVAGEVIQS
jgi:hypothetical protein